MYLLLQKFSRHDDHLLALTTVALTTERTGASARTTATCDTIENEGPQHGGTPPQGIRLDFTGISVSSVASHGGTTTMAPSLGFQIPPSGIQHYDSRARSKAQAADPSSS